MIYSKRLKSRLIAAICTLLIHIVLLGFLNLDFTGGASSKLSDAELEAFQLDMEDFDIPEEFLEQMGKDPLAKNADNASESISNEKGSNKPLQTEPTERTPEEQEQQAIETPDTLVVEKKTIVLETKKDSIIFTKNDSLVLAELAGITKTTKKTNSQNKQVLDNKARFEFYQKNIKNIKNFKKVYPYALKIKDITEGLNAQLSTMTNEDEKKKLIKETEKTLFKEYEGAVRTMTISQGKLLLKLVARETNKTGYDIIKEYKGAFPASFWYGVGKLFGQDLKSEFHKEQEDSLIEDILNKYESNDLYWNNFILK